MSLIISIMRGFMLQHAIQSLANDAIDGMSYVLQASGNLTVQFLFQFGSNLRLGMSIENSKIKSQKSYPLLFEM